MNVGALGCQTLYLNSRMPQQCGAVPTGPALGPGILSETADHETNVVLGSQNVSKRESPVTCLSGLAKPGVLGVGRCKVFECQSVKILLFTRTKDLTHEMLPFPHVNLRHLCSEQKVKAGLRCPGSVQSQGTASRRVGTMPTWAPIPKENLMGTASLAW